MLIIDLVLGAVTSSTLAPLVRGKFRPNWMYVNKPWSAAYISAQRNRRIKALWRTLNTLPFKSKAVLVGGTISAMQGTPFFKIKFGTEVVQVLGGTELVVPKRYWWWSRTRHRVSCGTEMDRYRNGSPWCGPEMVWYRTRPTPLMSIGYVKNS